MCGVPSMHLLVRACGSVREGLVCDIVHIACLCIQSLDVSRHGLNLRKKKLNMRNSKDIDVCVIAEHFSSAMMKKRPNESLEAAEINGIQLSVSDRA